MRPTSFKLLVFSQVLAASTVWFAYQQSKYLFERQPISSGNLDREGHAFMIAELARLLETTQFPDDFTLNSQAVDYYERRVDSATSKIDSLTEQVADIVSDGNDPSERRLVSKLNRNIRALEEKREQYLGNKIFHTLVAGDPAGALLEIGSLLDDTAILAGDRPPHFQELSELFEFKGTMHFVIGEQNNCQENHNARSCILPFHQRAFHINAAGAEMAIRYLRLALEGEPKNPESRWLYNLAHMTLGQYPQSVPKHLRIRFGKYDSELNFPYFPDRAPALGVDTQGSWAGPVWKISMETVCWICLPPRSNLTTTSVCISIGEIRDWKTSPSGQV